MTGPAGGPAAADLCAQLSESFDAAWHSAGGAESAHRCGGRPVRVRAAGAELSAHLQAVLPIDRDVAGTPGLTIDVWDVAATGVAPPVADAAAAFPRRWALAVGWMGRSEAGPFVADQRRESLFVLDRAGKRMVGWIERFSALSLNERSKPFGRLLRTWLHDTGVSVVHAALVARGDRGALVLGAKGAGKSTTALSCLLAGCDFVSDDLVALEEDGVGVIGHALNHSILLDLASAETLDGRAAAMLCARLPADPKRLLVPPRERTAAAARLGALLVPRRGAAGGGTRLRPTSEPALFRSIVASTLSHMSPRPGMETLRTLARTFERLPSYWLEMDEGVARIGDAVAGLLAADSTA